MSLPEIFQGADRRLVKKFSEYHQANPHVFAEFKAKAKRVKATGRERYSAWTIIQAMRWDSDLRTSSVDFKISNDFIALYARLLVHEAPEFDGFFSLHAMKKHRASLYTAKASR